VAWVGTKGEAGLCPEGAAADWKWFGRFSLAELAAVLERCDLWIGNDGGAMHLASAVGCPTLSLWGPTREGKWAPQGERDRAMRGGEACAGCRYWDWRAGCAKETHECMDGLGVDEVAAAALEMLGRGEG
jgi:ADP-heptose:LPS heptosyltransferase